MRLGRAPPSWRTVISMPSPGHSASASGTRTEETPVAGFMEPRHERIDADFDGSRRWLSASRVALARDVHYRAGAEGGRLRLHSLGSTLLHPRPSQHARRGATVWHYVGSPVRAHSR